MLLNKATTDLGRDAISEKELIMGFKRVQKYFSVCENCNAKHGPFSNKKDLIYIVCDSCGNRFKPKFYAISLINTKLDQTIKSPSGR